MQLGVPVSPSPLSFNPPNHLQWEFRERKQSLEENPFPKVSAIVVDLVLTSLSLSRVIVVSLTQPEVSYPVCSTSLATQ